MALLFDDMENAFLFVSMDQKFMHNAYLCKDSGQFFYTSELGDSDELPEDIDDTEKYISIPHKHDLELGRALVFDFTSEYIPEELDRIYAYFRSRGAYSRFKDFLNVKGLFDKWYTFEGERIRAALEVWCQENGIEIKG
ncbi:MAG: UPF0158 family protein [Desulfobacterales bacterium]|jgi:hypothetical protein